MRNAAEYVPNASRRLTELPEEEGKNASAMNDAR